MCSNPAARIERIGQAIEEIAAATEHTDLPELTRRLASLWAMVAELDPSVASRVRVYDPDA